MFTDIGPAVALGVAAVSLECAEPRELGSFYQQLLDGEIVWARAGSVEVRAGDIVMVAQ